MSERESLFHAATCGVHFGSVSCTCGALFENPDAQGQSNARVVHSKREPYDVYVGRPSKWGNPFSHRDGTQAIWKVESRDAAVDAYEAWIQTQPDLLAALPELRGKVLGCWCAPQRCHADVLVRLANV